MQRILVDNYLIETPISKIIELLRISLTNGKLKDIQDKSDDIVVSCPFHSGGQEEHGSCFIRKKDGVFHCFGCGEKGSFLKFVAKCFDAPESYAKAWLLKNFGGELVAKNLFMGEPIVLNRNKGIKKHLDESILDQYQTWNPYLAKRKLSREICELFKVRYDPKYRQVIFPTYDLKGNLVMMPKRSIDTKTFYLDSGVEKEVYCLDYIVKNHFTTALLTEGPFDVLTGWEYGYPTCGTFGKISEYQIEQLNKSCLKVIYTCFDNDTAGRRFTEIVKKKLAKRILVVEVQLPQGKKDLNDLTKEELDRSIKSAREKL